MKKLTNTLYMIIAVLAIAASQTATAQIHTTSSATLAKEPTATMQNVASAKVGHYGYTSTQKYDRSAQTGAGASYRVISPVGKQGKISPATAATLSGFSSSNTAKGNRFTNTITMSKGGITNMGVADDDEFIPGQDDGQGKDPYNNNGEGDPYAGGVTGVPMGNGTMALALLLLAYAAFIAVRKNRKEA